MSQGTRRSPFTVAGTLRVPGDKSISHRALMFAAFARGRSRVRGLLLGEDVESTARVLRALGAEVPPLSDDILIEGKGPASLRTPGAVLDCGNSGTTTRLMMGVLAGLDGRTARFDGDASLRKRPMRRVAQPLVQMGARVEYVDGPETGRLPLDVHGLALSPIQFQCEQASAQVKSAVLLAALMSGVEATVREPARSRDHTERMLAARGVSLELLHDGVRIPSLQDVQPLDTEVPGDPSSAAFIAALAAIADGGSVRLEGVCLNPTRTGFFDVLARMGARIDVEQKRLVGGEAVGTIVVHAATLSCVSVRGDEIPTCIDELPLVACLATRAQGETRICDAAELRVKESDRIGAVVANLRAIGADADELPDGMIIRGPSGPLRGRVTTHGDHRLAMAFGVLAACPDNAIVIDDPACVAVSYPGFWSDLASVVQSSSESATPPADNVVVAATTPHDADAVAHAPVPSPNARNQRNDREHRMVIAIDGPAASGKSSTAQWVAQQLGVRHVDSGAFYRALTSIALQSGTDAESWTEQAVLRGAARVGWRLTERSIAPLVDGTVADDSLRGTHVTRNVSRVASMPAVRDWVNQQVRSAAAAADVVVDGRDIGTAVFPDAPLKVFLIADPWERARRRLMQRLGRLPTDPEIADETELLVARDALDATQSAPARDAITIDTTRLTQEEQVERIVALARAAMIRGTRDATTRDD